MLLSITQIDINSAAIIILLGAILFFVSNIGKRIARLGKSSVTYLNTKAKIKAVEYAPSGIITIDNEGMVIAWNQGATTILGYSEKEMLGNPLFKVIPERNRERHIQGLLNAKNLGKNTMVGKTMDLTALGKDRTEFPVRLTLWKWEDEGHTFYTGIVRDITKEKETETRLSHLLEMYANAEEIDDSGVWSWDVLNDVVYTSKGYNKIYDIEPPDPMSSTYILKRIYYEDLPMVEKKIKEIFEKKEPYSIIHRLVLGDGRIISVETNGQPKCNEKGELISITGTTHIIT